MTDRTYQDGCPDCEAVRAYFDAVMDAVQEAEQASPGQSKMVSFIRIPDEMPTCEKHLPYGNASDDGLDLSEEDQQLVDEQAYFEAFDAADNDPDSDIADFIIIVPEQAGPGTKH